VAGSRRYKVLLYILLILALLSALYFIIYETNVILKEPGTTFAATIRVHEIVGDFTGEGYIVLDRNENTPSASDWAHIENGSVAYFSLAKNQRVEKEVTIKIPDAAEKGTYYIDYRVVMGEQLWRETIKFRVS
jgi:hypothetical protein